jgi:hypothetical protein
VAAAPEVGRRLKFIITFLLLTSAARPATYYVTIAGLGGSPEYEAQFMKWANDQDHELKAKGVDAHTLTLSGANATKTQIQAAFSKLASEMQPDDGFALLLIGHGSFDGTDYKFNIPGPDLTAAELAAMLNKLAPRRQLVVNMTSSSGACITSLARPGRIVITATKSGTEKNATLFARYWVDALRDPAADTDKSGSVSALEAYRYADRKTAEYFTSEKLLATEHPLLTDTSKPNPVRNPGPENGEGMLAAAFPLIRYESPAAENKPGKQRLLAKKEDLEAKIDRLKYQKPSMEEAEYKQQLSVLLLELARTQAEIDK